MEKQAKKNLFAWLPRLKQVLSSPKTLALVFAVYFVAGLCLAKDYGISLDETMERKTSIINYAYVMGEAMSPEEMTTVQSVTGPDSLTTWTDRFYGVALQCIPVLFEHLNGFAMPARDIFVVRHIFTFLNYFLGGVFFALILRRRFGKSPLPLLGALFYILYPRFFGESFYNIKDILFFSWFVIAAYFVLRWLEAPRGKFIFAAAAALAVTTNTRILGVSLLLLGCAFSFVQGLWQKPRFGAAITPALKLCAATFVCYVAITPFLWENPIKNSIDTFFHFIRFQPWNGTHLYLGQMIGREVPWHYIPVWMGATIPLLYMALFAVGFAAVCIAMVLFVRHAAQTGGIKAWLARQKEPANPTLPPPVRPAGPHLYDVFFFALFTCTLLGYILLRVSMYEGWRHAYCLFCPFLYMAVFGAQRAFALARGRGQILRPVLAGVVALGLCLQLGWIVRNHPYQYVYFNALGRTVAEKLFTLDYWTVSQADLLRYALAHDDSPQIKIAGEDYVSEKGNILTAEQNSRIIWTDLASADYSLGHSRAPYAGRLAPEGFRELISATADGMKISTLYKRETWPGEFDDSAQDNIIRMETGTSPETLAAMFDGDYNTRWSTGRPQQPGDYILFEFARAVDYDYIVMALGASFYDNPRGLSVSTSPDGNNWSMIPLTGSYQFGFKPGPYRFLKLENSTPDEAYAWSVAEMRFGYFNQRAV